LKDGAFATGRGSLGEVLPESVRNLLAAAAQADGAIEWTAPSGRAYTFKVCRAQPAPRQPAAAADAVQRPPDRFAPPLADSAAVQRVGSGSPDPPIAMNVSRAAAAGEPGGSAESLERVPFSLENDTEPTRVLRGTIDRLIRHADGSIVVLARSSELELALRAVRRMFPAAVVTDGVTAD